MFRGLDDMDKFDGQFGPQHILRLYSMIAEES